MSKIGNVLSGFGKGFMKNFKLLARNKVGLFGLFVIVALVLICFVGPLIVPPETRSDTTAINKPPSAAHPLGTDFMGRENWIMFIHGGREVMIVAFLAGLFTTAIAVVVGAVSPTVAGARRASGGWSGPFEAQAPSSRAAQMQAASLTGRVDLAGRSRRAWGAGNFMGSSPAWGRRRLAGEGPRRWPACG